MLPVGRKSQSSLKTEISQVFGLGRPAGYKTSSSVNKAIWCQPNVGVTTKYTASLFGTNNKVPYICHKKLWSEQANFFALLFKWKLLLQSNLLLFHNAKSSLSIASKSGHIKIERISLRNLLLLYSYLLSFHNRTLSSPVSLCGRKTKLGVLARNRINNRINFSRKKSRVLLLWRNVQCSLFINCEQLV